MTINFLKILSFWQREEVCRNLGKGSSLHPPSRSLWRPNPP